jgi:hypothetical protein
MKRTRRKKSNFAKTQAVTNIRLSQTLTNTQNATRGALNATLLLEHPSHTCITQHQAFSAYLQPMSTTAWRAGSAKDAKNQNPPKLRQSPYYYLVTHASTKLQSD